MIGFPPNEDATYGNSPQKTTSIIHIRAASSSPFFLWIWDLGASPIGLSEIEEVILSPIVNALIHPNSYKSA